MSYIVPLLAALCWAFSVILLKKSDDSISAVSLNLYKNFVGFIFLILTCLIFIPLNEWSVQSNDFLILGISGFLGIGIADALVLKALKKLHASHLAILECLFSPMVILCSVFYLKESLTIIQVLGIVVISSAVFLSNSRKITSIDKKDLIVGSLFMFFGLFTMAWGIVLVKPILEVYPILLSSTIRMGFGLVSSILVYLKFSDGFQLVGEIVKAPKKLTIFLACIMSSYISYVLWLWGYKFNDASITSVLNSTSTVFTVILAIIFLNEKVTFSKIAATFMAMVGVILVTYH